MFLKKETEACHGPLQGWQTLAQGPACQMNKRSLGASKGTTQGYTASKRRSQGYTREASDSSALVTPPSHGHPISIQASLCRVRLTAIAEGLLSHINACVQRGAAAAQRRHTASQWALQPERGPCLLTEPQDASLPPPPVTHQPSDLKGTQRLRPCTHSHRRTSPHTASPRTMSV